MYYVMMCCDGNYIQHAAVFLVSLAQNNRSDQFQVVLACDDITIEIEEKFSQTFETYKNINIQFSRVLGNVVGNLPISFGLTKESWGRIFIDEYFPPHVEKVFYFDVDMVVTGALTALLTMDVSGHLLAAVSIPGSKRTAVHGYDPSHGYFNSGVLVINLRKWREADRPGALIAYTKAHPERVNDPDQDALNGCFHAERLHLDFIWNAITPFFRSDSTLPLAADELERVRRDSRIVHFTGQSKPWLFMCNHPRKADYLRYLRMTAWRGYRYPDRTALNVVKWCGNWILGEALLQRCKRQLLRRLAWRG